MIKTVTYFEYQALKVIGKKITVLRANDNTATIIIGKQTDINQTSLNKQSIINQLHSTKQYSSLSEVVPRRQLNQLVDSAGKVARNCLQAGSSSKIGGHKV